ncbi:hypothetical protein LF817_19245 [Halobacillus sp. A1]|uniref:hypothetical protein n=1 Tax=Halobacillus sp. A1 TaxID=2880262 RepID=UPI0020A6921A|nr:hypothetical protein [Halobacillus sp. A1]MCP3033464.1 hypothetical protein [Halobacillus sp. A1]
MKKTNEEKSTLEQFDNTMYARVSVNNMPRITALVEHTEEEQKEIDDIFATNVN